MVWKSKHYQRRDHEEEEILVEYLNAGLQLEQTRESILG
jgi:hypothetical protein